MTVQLPTPWSLNEIKPELFVYGPNNESTVISHEVNAKTAIAKLKESGFLSHPQIVFIAHGFWSNAKTQWLQDMKDKMIELTDQTVVIVGWGKGAELPAFKYPQSAANIEPIGVWLAAYVLEIKKKIGNKIKIWGIGHGLGAHLMGIAGRNCSAFSRITGVYGFRSIREMIFLN
jgi:hypothetical protein